MLIGQIAGLGKERASSSPGRSGQVRFARGKRRDRISSGGGGFSWAGLVLHHPRRLVRFLRTLATGRTAPCPSPFANRLRAGARSLRRAWDRRLVPDRWHARLAGYSQCSVKGRPPGSGRRERQRKTQSGEGGGRSNTPPRTSHPWQKPYATPLHHGDEHDLREVHAITSSTCGPARQLRRRGLLLCACRIRALAGREHLHRPLPFLRHFAAFCKPVPARTCACSAFVATAGSPNLLSLPEQNMISTGRHRSMIQPSTLKHPSPCRDGGVGDLGVSAEGESSHFVPHVEAPTPNTIMRL